MRLISQIVLLLAATTLYFYVSISGSVRTECNDVAISITDSAVPSGSLSIAVVGDLHLPEGAEPLSAFRALLMEVKSAEPDLVVLVGDYISHPNNIYELKNHRENIINTIKLFDPLPRAVILGNYESWSDADEWLSEFQRLGVSAMENEVQIITTNKGSVCVRGLGDSYTNRFVYVEYPATCKTLPKLSITHDPAGAFDDRMNGLVIAGHTHCGQVSLPFTGPIWEPSDAPESAPCGLYEDEQRTVFVISGVGTSMMPIRYRAQSNWDLLSLQFN